MSTRKLKLLDITGLQAPGLMIRILRYANQWTAQDLVDEMKALHPADISRYETGDVFPTKEAMKKLCKAFKVSPSFLFISPKTHPETIKYFLKLLDK